MKIVTRQSTDRFAVNEDAVLQALEFINERTAGSFSVDDVAQAAGISRRLLEMRFRALLGYGIYEEVQRLRLERVIHLLHDPKLRLADIAQAAGFGSAAKLSVAFLVRYSVTPSSFRKMHFGIGRKSRELAAVAR